MEAEKYSQVIKMPSRNISIASATLKDDTPATDYIKTDHMASIQRWLSSSEAVRSSIYTSLLSSNADKPKAKSHNPRMSELSREELDAKLDATNARVDARLAAFENTVRETLAAIRQDSSEMRGELKAIHVDLSYLKNIKGSIWGAAGATVIGVGGILVAMLSFGVASYDTARENTVLVSESRAQIVESQQKVSEALTTMNTQLAESRKQADETRQLLELLKVNLQDQQPKQQSQPNQ